MSKLRKIVRTTLFPRKKDDGIELGRGGKPKLYCGSGGNDGDKEFGEPVYGMHVLNPERKDVNVDIIAVHGLGGHAFHSWTHEPTNKMWLRDFLPHQVPRARIATFGYDARVAGSRAVVESLDSAQSLLLDVKLLRSTPEERERPLVLIGHSLGGIIIKKALVIAQQRADSHCVLDKLCCAVFLGVPHLGSSVANTAETLVSIAQLFGDFNTRHLEDLKKESPSLRDLAQAFGQLEGFKIITVTEGTETVIPFTKKSVHVVPQSSASLHMGARETVISIDGADHHMICKFGDSGDGQYSRIWKSINRFLAEWESKYRIQVNRPPAPPSQNIEARQTVGFPPVGSPVPSPSGYTPPITPEQAEELSFLARRRAPTPPIELDNLIARRPLLTSSRTSPPAPPLLLREPTYSFSLSRSSTLPVTSSPFPLSRTSTALTTASSSSSPTPQTLHKAVRERNVSLAKHVLEQTFGNDVNSANVQGRYPLSIAAAMGDEDLVRLLLFWGADVHAQDDRGRTALHRAAGCGMAGVVKILLEKGANREVADFTGRTALEWTDKEAIKGLLLEEQSPEEEVD
ncbi:unnamed protein product [Tuber aestivum]|uniref:DUF676 domain-containing protein n=1 Tax=Tuber aestivum TaxID=59557 RepID=A0A292Q0K3_9PEZI|nr:unnamed protein product [Tuber aestivum]